MRYMTIRWSMEMCIRDRFYVQLNILRYAKDRQKRYRGYIFEKVGDVFNTFYTKNLPFQLTGAQKLSLIHILCTGWKYEISRTLI